MSKEQNAANLHRYKTLFKNERHWVFENSKEVPYDSWTKDYSVLMVDLDLNVLLACANWQDDGSLWGEAIMGQGVTFDAVDAEGMVLSVLQIESDLLDY